MIVQDSPDTAKQVTDALLRISHTNVACSYNLVLPDGGDIDPNRVNVRLTEAGKGARLLSYVAPRNVPGGRGLLLRQRRAPQEGLPLRVHLLEPVQWLDRSHRRLSAAREQLTSLSSPCHSR